jgi:hypothetical protein
VRTHAEAQKTEVRGVWKLIYQRFFDQKPIREILLPCN